jgi:hypothetical protein
MTAALYLSIWLALVSLLAAEVGRRRNRQTLVTARWAILCSMSGVLLAGVHTLLALGVAYDWDHGRAVTVTAERAATVYGVAWSGSLYVNYVFLAWWLLDTIWWWRAPASFVGRPWPIEWLWRITVLTMVVNGAVIFASPAGRFVGVPLVVALLLVWAKAVKRPSGQAST